MRRLILLLAVLGTVCAGCAPGRASGPPKIVYGKEACSECHMIITEKKFSAAVVDAVGEVSKFDDIGCAWLYIKEGQAVMEQLWVRDDVTEEWMDGEKAVYVVSDALKTPMGHGVAAFRSESDAQKLLVQYHGELVSWDKMGASFLNNPHSIKGGSSNESK